MTYLRRRRKDAMKINDDELMQRVIDALKKIFDPEIPVNIYELGLIYDIKINPQQEIHIQMTLTTPACPVAQTFPSTVEEKIKEIDDVSNVTVELVWDPPWTQDRMTQAARLELGLL